MTPCIAENSKPHTYTKAQVLSTGVLLICLVVGALFLTLQHQQVIEPLPIAFYMIVASATLLAVISVCLLKKPIS